MENSKYRIHQNSRHLRKFRSSRLTAIFNYRKDNLRISEAEAEPLECVNHAGVATQRVDTPKQHPLARQWRSEPLTANILVIATYRGVDDV